MTYPLPKVLGGSPERCWNRVMDWVDFLLLMTLAVADALLLVYLRRRRRRLMCLARMQHSLVLAIRQVNRSEQARRKAATGSLAKC